MGFFNNKKKEELVEEKFDAKHHVDTFVDFSKHYAILDFSQCPDGDTQFLEVLDELKERGYKYVDYIVDYEMCLLIKE